MNASDTTSLYIVEPPGLWDAVSMRMFDMHVIRTIKACIKGFLWAGNKKDNAAAKVSWSTLILPKSKGGLGLIDPGFQSQSLEMSYMENVDS